MNDGDGGCRSSTSGCIVFKDEVVSPKLDVGFHMSFHSNYSTPDEEIVLVYLGAGNAAFWMIVSIDNNNEIWISPRFGNKSDYISCKTKENVLFMNIGSFDYPDKYIYFKKKLIHE